jgi:rare lipoprotein A
MKSLDSRSLPFLALAAFSMVCGATGAAGAGAKSPANGPANGPAADYPLVIGGSYTVVGAGGSANFTPSDTLNYDAVGYATVASEGGSTVTGAHHTLPLPCYVEVTSLGSGQTIVVRLERRGPMAGTNLIELSPGAATQLGLTGSGAGKLGAAVRVRRVLPPEAERAMLRAGARAPARMTTPAALLAVLMRKLAPDTVQLAGGAGHNGDAGSAPTGSREAAKTAATVANAMLAKGRPGKKAPAKPALVAKSAEPAPLMVYHEPLAAVPTPAVRPAPKPHPELVAAKPKRSRAAPVAPEAEKPVGAHERAGTIVVQAGAFGLKANADTVAAKLGAGISQSGHLWRVRMGPFANSAQAEAALAKARTAGYSRARILRGD